MQGGGRTWANVSLLNVSHSDTYVLSLKNSECLSFDSLEGVVEAATKSSFMSAVYRSH